MKFTIFTPTYNRAYLLKDLYISLITQSEKDFEWLVVDDGSTDNTKELIEGFKNENLIDIKYVVQENGGKHRAINTGLDLANGELFFIVDSDDSLFKNSLEIILNYASPILEDKKIAGVVGFIQFKNTENSFGKLNKSYIDSNSIEAKYRYNVNKDMAEVVKTEVLKKYRFPDIQGEKFVAESIVWNKIAIDYNFRYIKEFIYIAEYLEDGLTQNTIKNRVNNPKYATLLYSELASNPKASLKVKIKAMINFWRFSYYLDSSFFSKFKMVGRSIITLLFYPVGFFIYVKDQK